MTAANFRCTLRRAAFTLVELLAAMAVLALLMVVITQMFSSVAGNWRSTGGMAHSFAAARAATEALSRHLSQATLATYLSYADSQGRPVPLINPSYKPSSGAVDRSAVPTQYLRMSELHFVSRSTSRLLQEAGVTGLQTTGQGVFFQAPTGFALKQENRPKGSLLNTLGYYIEFGSSGDFQPGPASSAAIRHRYRLMEVVQPAEQNGIYESTCEIDANGLPVHAYDLAWITRLQLSGSAAPKQPLAENIIALALLPRLSPLHSADPAALSDDFSYDSRAWEKDPSSPSARVRTQRNQLPPLMDLVLVAMDEPSAEKMAELYGGPGKDAPPFANAQVRAQVDLDSLFQDPLALDDDLHTLEKGLNALGVSHRIFRTSIALPGSKWSD